MRVAVLAGLVFGLAGCQGEPAPISFGRDECAYCRMTITDPRWAAELVTRQGKTHKFDSIECLAGFLAGGRIPAEHVHSAWVTDFARGERLIPAGEALYLRSGQLRSPMGLNLAAFSQKTDFESARARYGGEGNDWDRVLALVREAGFLERRPAGQGTPSPR